MPFRLEARQTLTTDLDTAWAFFSDPRNLADLTPPDMHFRLTSRLTSRLTGRRTGQLTGEPAAEAYPGMVITYRLTPLLNIEVPWATEITHIRAPEYFADAQLLGPYALWHHQHLFRELERGVEASDIVHWALPLEPLSAPIAHWLVIPRLRQIFRYRARRLRERFGAIGDPELSFHTL